jgi:hypothetical protein
MQSTETQNQTPVNHAQADLLLNGNSLYLDIGQEKHTVVHYGNNGETSVLHASGKRDSGRWTLESDGTYSVDWLDGPKGSKSQVRWAAGDIRIFALSGEFRGRVSKIVPGKVPELE